MTPDRDYLPRLANALQAHRRNGATFEAAWAAYMERDPFPPDEFTPATQRFVCDHFRAAYNRDQSKRGRLNVEHDNVAAVLITTRPPSPLGSDDDPRCKSPDGCDRVATRGRFGLWWCDHHGAELERIAESMRGETDTIRGAAPGKAREARESAGEASAERARRAA